jgi:hypothetical protein
MTIKDQLLRSVTQLETDSGLVHSWAHGDAATQINTERGPVRSPAKLIADKDGEINQAANGLLTRAVSAANHSEASANTATQQASAAAGSASRAAISESNAAASANASSDSAMRSLASQTAAAASEATAIERAKDAWQSSWAAGQSAGRAAASVVQSQASADSSARSAVASDASADTAANLEFLARVETRVGEVMAGVALAGGSLSSTSADRANVSATTARAQADLARTAANAALMSRNQAVESEVACAAYVEQADVLVVSPYTQMAAHLIATQAVVVEHHAFT